MKLTHPQLSWSEQGHPFSEEFSDIYFSSEDPLGESQYVFIEGSKLEHKLSLANNKTFTIGELGFGSGLNFLLCWRLWKKLQPTKATFHYIAFEKYPLDSASHERIFNLWPELKDLSDALLPLLPAPCYGCHRILLHDSVILDLHFGDALERLRTLDKRSGVDCWFLDGFNPRSNKELWQRNLLREISRLSKQDSCLVSYSVAGELRRGLEKFGFSCEKLAGFGRKRHMLRGIFKQAQTTGEVSLANAWNLVPLSKTEGNEVAIVGAGLAGSTLAYSLAGRGVGASVFESSGRMAAAASGITQFALRPRLFQAESPLLEFYLQSYLFTVSQLQQLSDKANLNWQQCGLIQLEQALNKQANLEIERIRDNYPESVIQLLQDSDLQGAVRLGKTEGLFFPLSGWLAPAELCNMLIELSKARLYLDTQIVELRRSNEQWILRDSNQNEYTYKQVVIANSFGATHFSQCEGLSIESVAGQTSTVAGSAHSALQQSVVCGSRTVFPSTTEKEIRHLIAASYRNDSNLNSAQEDDLLNLESARQNFKHRAYLGDQIIESQVGIRSNTADRIPLVGQLPDKDAIHKNYGELSRNARKDFTLDSAADNYWPGLYISAAHGSNGLATCGMSAEILTSLLLNEQLPVSQSVLDEINPVRFIIRALKKQQA